MKFRINSGRRTIGKYIEVLLRFPDLFYSPLLNVKKKARRQFNHDQISLNEVVPAERFNIPFILFDLIRAQMHSIKDNKDLSWHRDAHVHPPLSPALRFF